MFITPLKRSVRSPIGPLEAVHSKRRPHASAAPSAAAGACPRTADQAVSPHSPAAAGTAHQPSTTVRMAKAPASRRIRTSKGRGWAVGSESAEFEQPGPRPSYLPLRIRVAEIPSFFSSLRLLGKRTESSSPADQRATRSWYRLLAGFPDCPPGYVVQA
jgi:hypothetical protein